MLPTGTASIVFSLDPVSFYCWAPQQDDKPLVWSRSVLHGPQSSYYMAGAKPPGTAVGVAFAPGAVAAVVGMPASEIVDRHVPLDHIWGCRGVELHDRLRAATGPHAAFAILEETFGALLKRSLLIHPAVAYSIARPVEPLRTRVADLHDEVGYSSRHLTALFRTSVGLTPSQYFRIRRFAFVARMLAGPKPIGLADLAASSGYADQSHLNREFREFSGTTPLRYRPRDRDSPFHHSLEKDGAR
jgi:AraC-like DNA-binding protein